MKVIVFGLGSIGKRHAKMLKEHFNCEVFAFREKKNESKNDLGIEEISSWEAVENINPEAAFITNPTFMHMETAIKCAARGMRLFIEKPLSNSLEGIDQLRSLCEKKGLTCYIAYCLRFHPVIKELKRILLDKKVFHARIVCSSYLPDWRKGDTKAYYSASAEKGGGVLLDLSHELDYVQYLFGEIMETKAFFGRIAELTVDAEDFADILIRTKNMLPVNVHLNFLSLLEERKIIIDYKGGYVIGDLLNGRIERRDGDNIAKKTLPCDRNVYLKEQLTYYFDNIDNKNIMNNLNEANGLLSKILEIKNG